MHREPVQTSNAG